MDHNQQPVRLYGIVQDITDRKLAEIERNQIVDSLINRNNDLEQFTYIVSHNLRAPLANIIGIADLMNATDIDPAERKELTEGLYTSSAKLDDVVKDLTHILQIRKTQDKKKELVHFSKLVDDVILSLGMLNNMTEIKVTTDFSEIDELFTVKTYLYSIFYNLISNSIKYRWRESCSFINISSHLKNNKLSILFSDNGTGIDLEKNGGQVFVLYKRFHADIEGKGMGLFMVKTQVETLGGKISVKSKVNIGTEFKIEFNI